MRRSILSLFCLLLLVQFSTAQTQTADGRWCYPATGSYQDSVFDLYSLIPGTEKDADGPKYDGASGCCVAWDAKNQEAHILTAKHFLEDGRSVMGYDHKGRTLHGRILAAATWDDLALVALKSTEPVRPVPLATIPLKDGDEVRKCAYPGYAQGQRNERTGHVFAARFASYNLKASQVRVSMVVRAGDSGGPLVNRDGQLVGVIVGCEGTSQNPIDYAACVDLEHVRRFLERKR